MPSEPARAHSACGPASRFTCTDAVDVIIAAAGGTGLAGREELLHGAIAVAGVDPLGGSQRVRAEQHQTETRLSERRSQHRPVGGHGLDRGQRAVHRRSGQFDRAARFDGDQAAAGESRDGRNDRGELVPVRPAPRVGDVEAVCFDLQADPADRAIGQTVGTDVAARPRSRWSARCRRRGGDALHRGRTRWCWSCQPSLRVLVARRRHPSSR